MDGFSDKLKTILSDPESLNTIMNLAKGFTGPPSPGGPREEGQGGEEDSAAWTPPASAATDLMNIPGMGDLLHTISSGSRERIDLLQAMRPFVKETKKPKLDKIIQAMKTLDLFTTAQKLL